MLSRRSLIRRAITLFVFPFKLLKRAAPHSGFVVVNTWPRHMFALSDAVMAIPRPSFYITFDSHHLKAHARPVGWFIERPKQTSCEKRHSLLRDFHGLQNRDSTQPLCGMRLLSGDDHDLTGSGSGRPEEDRTRGQTGWMVRTPREQPLHERQRLSQELDRVSPLSRVPEERSDVQAHPEKGAGRLPSAADQGGEAEAARG